MNLICAYCGVQFRDCKALHDYPGSGRSRPGMFAAVLLPLVAVVHELCSTTEASEPAPSASWRWLITGLCIGVVYAAIAMR
jgi:hypothetical protein